MNITVEKEPACIAKLSVEIPEDRVASKRKDIVSKFAKDAKVKGFRPGKTPTSIIEKRYEKEIREELFSQLVNIGCDEAIRSEELSVLSVSISEEPKFHDAGELSFKAELILEPEFELPEYTGLEVSVPQTDVSDEEQSKALEDLRQRFAQFNDVERELQDGDFAVIDFTTTMDGKPVAEAIGKSAGFLDGREDHWAKIEDGAFMPGLAEGLKGLKAGDKKQLALTMTDDFPISDIQSAEIVFDIEVKSVKEQELPELDDDFAAKLLPNKTLDEIKDLVLEQLQNEKNKAAEEAKIEQIVDQLNTSVTLELPEAFVANEIQGNAMSMIDRARQQGMTDEMIEEQESEILASAEKQARLNLKTNFILQKIANKEGIELSDQDLLQRISQMAQQAGTPLKKYIKELKKAEGIKNVQNSVLIGKTIDFLIEKANVSVEETDSTESLETAKKDAE